MEWLACRFQKACAVLLACFAVYACMLPCTRPLPCFQVALKLEHRSSKGCNYGPPYEWSVYG